MHIYTFKINSFNKRGKKIPTPFFSYHLKAKMYDKISQRLLFKFSDT